MNAEVHQFQDNVEEMLNDFLSLLSHVEASSHKLDEKLVSITGEETMQELISHYSTDDKKFLTKTLVNYQQTLIKTRN